MLVLLMNHNSWISALAAADHAADFRAGYFFIDVFGCLLRIPVKLDSHSG
ncbi:MAG: hypothetical protein IPF57_14490 [Gammaproteobacteria bacterium]|nr:hypothetical protein [Gammaproteobacteria bacterium]